MFLKNFFYLCAVDVYVENLLTKLIMQMQKKKSFREKITQLNWIVNNLNDRIDFHEELFQFFIKLSLDYEYAVRQGYPIEKMEMTVEIAELYKMSQIHIRNREKLIRRMQSVQKFIQKNRLSMFVSSRRMNKQSYYDNIL